MTTAADYEQAIENAIKAKDIPALGVLLAQLARVDPDRAQLVRDTLRLGVLAWGVLRDDYPSDDIQTGEHGES